MFYDKSIMRHIEMHLIESSKDVQTCNLTGLDVSDDESCEECFKPVGESASGSSKFVSFVLCLDDESEWVVCSECASPVL
jgi:hypothetical protein